MSAVVPFTVDEWEAAVTHVYTWWSTDPADLTLAIMEAAYASTDSVDVEETLRTALTLKFASEVTA